MKFVFSRKKYFLIKIFFPLEYKLHMLTPPCNILYIQYVCYKVRFLSTDLNCNVNAVAKVAKSFTSQVAHGAGAYLRFL